MTAVELRDVIQVALPKLKTMFVLDRDYAKPSRGWLMTTFAEFYQRWLNENSLAYRNSFDCENFAALYAVCASCCHARTRTTTAQGIAVGEAYYQQNGDPNRGHAINCAVTDMGFIFIEPQTQKQVHLTNAELDSCWFVRF